MSDAAKAVVERFISACNAADTSQAWSMLSPTIVVDVSGSTWFSGRCEGEEQLRRVLLATVQEYLHEPRVTLMETIVEDEQVAALIEVSGRARNGQHHASLGAPWGVVITLRGARIDRIELFPDTMFIETALCGAVYEPNDPSRVLV
jgi:ketosteroid isomerase-like protein